MLAWKQINVGLETEEAFIEVPPNRISIKNKAVSQ